MLADLESLADGPSIVVRNAEKAAKTAIASHQMALSVGQQSRKNLAACFIDSHREDKDKWKRQQRTSGREWLKNIALKPAETAAFI